MHAGWALSPGTACGGEGSRAGGGILRDAATRAEHSKPCPKAQHPSERLSRQPQAATVLSAAELISACNQQGMKGR